MRVNPWVSRLRSIALGVSTGALLGCGPSELGTVHVPDEIRRKAEPAFGPGAPGSRTVEARPQVGR
jgi:hypothetical protein